MEKTIGPEVSPSVKITFFDVDSCIREMHDEGDAAVHARSGYVIGPPVTERHVAGEYPRVGAHPRVASLVLHLGGVAVG